MASSVTFHPHTWLSATSAGAHRRTKTAARRRQARPLCPGASLRVSPDWIHGLKSTMLQVASNYRALFEEMATGDENLSLAMVPWAPAKAHAHAASSSTSAGAEMMDAD
ncbi:unnamed protein product [Miscanthus lutarioriparius]|uniref:Uncharacterized protein n=1 Tax=Miscanthus lutarioriparius TaxID=422564 RepID=A0A811NXZ8_9POAL|nr:unnamed protein product [Miscanthus lutarioriparius]